MIKIDDSQAGMLIVCTECSYWYAWRETRVEAYIAGEGHLIRVHDVPAERADNARRSYEARQRHAVRT